MESLVTQTREWLIPVHITYSKRIGELDILIQVLPLTINYKIFDRFSRLLKYGILKVSTNLVGRLFNFSLKLA